MSARAMLKTSIGFGLVRVPVAVYKATESQEVKFHQVHTSCGTRISKKSYCPGCDKEIPFEEVGRGIEVADKSTVAISEEEQAMLNAAKGEENGGEVLAFCDPDQIDPPSLENSYYLKPLDHAEQAYVLLRTALDQRGEVGICTIKLSSAGEKKLAVLRTRGDVLMLTVVLYKSQVREPDFEIPEVHVTPTEVRLASDLIGSMRQDFNADDHYSAYREAQLALAAAKASGTTTPAPTTKAAPAVSTSLADALKASIEAQAKAAGKAPKKAATGRRRAS